ncbi:MAG: KpsF/GutQ family sugar-phosphate isomerase, partial [Bacteroidota bacterium]
ALVAKKIVATLNSTGTPALFLHAADAIHGDIGMVQPDDLVICLSKSGETAEVKMLALMVRQAGNPLVVMVSRPDCSLAVQADYVLLTPISREADPNDLAPTASTTAQMALGDALATALLALRGFTPGDFARYHPGGSLGKQLYLRVSDLYPANPKPTVSVDSPLREILLEMTSKRLGATAVVAGDEEKLVGIITDGDLRRMLTGNPHLETLTAREIMTSNPKTIAKATLAIKALEKLRAHNINQLVVVGDENEYLGFLHLHDLIREGLV